MLTLPSATVDLDARELYRGGTRIALTTQECAVLAFLAAADGRVVSREDLLAEVWGYAPRVITRAVDATISRLRAKLEDDPSAPRSLHSIRGLGYRLVVLPSGPAPLPLPSALPSALLGRQREQASAQQALAGGGIVQLTGPGGIGKTVLARELAGEVHRFVDVSAGRTPNDLLVALSSELRVPLSDRSAAASAALLGDALSASSAPVILDNLEQLPAETAVLLRTLRDAAGGVPLILTSRRPMVEDWPIVDLAPLGDADALALLSRSARRAWREPEREALAVVVARADGSPLALELLGARLAVLSAPDLVAHLDDPALLSARDGRGGRQETLRATVQWSLALLSPAAARALRSWSVFRGVVPLDLARAVLPEEDDVLRIVDELRAAALLDGRGDGIRPWVAVQAAAREELERRGELTRALVAHRDAVLAALPRDREPQGRDLAEARAAVRRLANELIAIGERSVRTAPEAAVRALLALVLIEGQFDDEERARLEAMAQAAADASADPELRASARLWTANRLVFRDTRAARAQIEDLDDVPELRPAMLRIRAKLARVEGRPDEALELFAAARLGAGPALEVGIDLDEAMLLRQIGREDEARRLLLQVAASGADAGDRYTEGMARLSLAGIERRAGQLDSARHQAQQAVALFRADHDRNRAGSALAALGAALTALGRLDEAAEACSEACALQRATGNRSGEASSWANLGGLHLARGALTEAELAMTRALQLAEAAGAGLPSGFVHRQLGLVSELQGRSERALAHYERAAEVLRAAGFGPLLAQTHAMAAVSLAALGRADEARAALPVDHSGIREDAQTQSACAEIVATLLGDDGLRDPAFDEAELRADPTMAPLVALLERARSGSSRRSRPLR